MITKQKSKNIIILIVALLLLICFAFLIPNLTNIENTYQKSLNSKSFIETIFMFLVFAAIETLIAQALICEIILSFKFLKSLKNIVVILLSSTSFGFLHYDSSISSSNFIVIFYFLTGIIFAFIYLYFRKYGIMKSIIITTSFHFWVNICLYLIDLLELS